MDMSIEGSEPSSPRGQYIQMLEARKSMKEKV